MNPEDLKLIVKEKYGDIAKQSLLQNETSCCGSSGCCSSFDYTTFSESYQHLDGYHADADLNLGCAIPTQFASINKGDYVLDLGSGAGNDCFVVRAIVGESGQVTGLDFTEAMLHKATDNTQKLGFTNVRFVKGDIEEMPLPDNQFDVVVSNCVLNLVPDKHKAFAQIKRVLKHKGHFCVSDIVIKGDLPDSLRKNAELYAGCVAGAINIDQYLNIIHQQGFVNVTVHKQTEIILPDAVLLNTLSHNELMRFKNGDIGIFSITVSGHRK